VPPILPFPDRQPDSDADTASGISEAESISSGDNSGDVDDIVTVGGGAGANAIIALPIVPSEPEHNLRYVYGPIVIPPGLECTNRRPTPYYRVRSPTHSEFVGRYGTGIYDWPVNIPDGAVYQRFIRYQTDLGPGLPLPRMMRSP